jgi:hypothetical protein
MGVPLDCEALYPSVSLRLNPTRGSSTCNVQLVVFVYTNFVENCIRV